VRSEAESRACAASPVTSSETERSGARPSVLPFAGGGYAPTPGIQGQPQVPGQPQVRSGGDPDRERSA